MKLPSLFRLTSTINLIGSRNVMIYWYVHNRAEPTFGAHGAVGSIGRYEDAVEGYFDGWYESAIDELFTAAEAEAFAMWARERRGYEITIHEVPLPFPSSIKGYCGRPLAIGEGNLSFYNDDDYDLEDHDVHGPASFGVGGHYDLCTEAERRELEKLQRIPNPPEPSIE
jgi:hypothetical protein